jgi:hypothetical protein
MQALKELALDLLPRSLMALGDAECGLAREAGAIRLVVLAPLGSPPLADLEGERSEHAGRTLVVGPASARNAQALRRQFAWLVARPIGLRTSIGLGDRLGLATPGHVRALRAGGPDLAPIFAQQSIREMSRTGRTPQQVIDAATFGAFEEGWQAGMGADADHLKEPGDIDRCLAAGFTLFTVDPGEFVETGTGTASAAKIDVALAALPWQKLEDSLAALRARYLGRRFDLDGTFVTFDEASLARAAVKYGGAVAHVTAMYRHLARAAAGRPFEVEVSVDETDDPTSYAEHVYVASELRRLGVRWVGLAPRFVGEFEKGVDYIGDVRQFESHFAGHAAIARALGPYKLSLHSGSDKFSVYPIVAAHARGLVHVKTAGTSYLEALRAVAAIDPALFREIYVLARERYETDRASYRVSARLDRAPEPRGLQDERLGQLLDEFDAREILHVTFGSVMGGEAGGDRPNLAGRLLAALGAHPEVYAANLEAHLARHMAPFSGGLAARRSHGGTGKDLTAGRLKL